MNILNFSGKKNQNDISILSHKITENNDLSRFRYLFQIHTPWFENSSRQFKNELEKFHAPYLRLNHIFKNIRDEAFVEWIS